MNNSHKPILRSDGTVTTWLKGIGYATAKAAGDLKPGDVIVYHWGYRGTVLEVKEVSAKTVQVTVRLLNGPGSPKCYRKATLVVCALPHPESPEGEAL